MFQFLTGSLSKGLTNFLNYLGQNKSINFSNNYLVGPLTARNRVNLCSSRRLREVAAHPLEHGRAYPQYRAVVHRLDEKAHAFSACMVLSQHLFIVKSVVVDHP